MQSYSSAAAPTNTAAARAVPWNWRPAAALAVALGVEAEPEALPLALEPVEEVPTEPVAEPEVAVAVTKPEEVAVTLEMSVEKLIS